MDNKFITTEDGTCTLFSKQFNQHYHNIKDGALTESLNKHVIPSLEFHHSLEDINILDICFGLGYNTLATIYYLKKHTINKKITIYSPEFDYELIKSLKDFKYPKEFNFMIKIIEELSNNHYYKDENIEINIFIGDAREYLKILTKEKIKFNIVYQDAFSSEVNKLLWTKEYFSDITALLDNNGIITTYSISTPIRLAMYENGLHIYQYKASNTLKQTVAFKTAQTMLNNTNYTYIDMELKQQRNPLAESLKDK